MKRGYSLKIRNRRRSYHHHNSNGGNAMKSEDRRLVLYYFNNVLKGLLSPKVQENLWDWAERHSQELFRTNLEALREEEEEALAMRDLRHWERARRENEAKFRLLRRTAGAANLPATPDRKGQVGAISEKIADSFRLKEAERDVLRLFVGAMSLPVLDDLMDEVTGLNHYQDLNRANFPALALLLGCPAEEVERAFNRESPLMLNGLFDMDGNGEIGVSTPLKRMVNQPRQAGRDVKSLVLEEKTKARLTPANFEHLAKEFADLAKLLRNGLNGREPGLNVILYGPAGSGKTEMAKTLAAEIKADLYPISETSTESKPSARLSELLMARALLAGDPKAILLLDEAEDLLDIWHTKIFFNRLLENNKTPAIWITNHIRDFDETYLRRFFHLLEVKTPPASARARIWRGELARNNVEMADEEIDRLAKNYDMPPSFAVSAIRAAKLMEDNGAIERNLNSMHYAITGRRKPNRDQNKVKFNPALLNTDTDLAKLTERIVSGQSLNFSLCLFGAPGTGKSEYVRHLAERMGLDVLHKRASDLLSMWVGETEKNIAAAFQEAEEEKKFLIFDEAESFLLDRSSAHRSWEVTQVNEMLTWLEGHPYPLACTSNLKDRLDPAAISRFTFKVKYDFLTRAQARLAFRHFFGQDFEVKLDALAPRDFMMVARKASIMGLTDPAELAGLLAQEQEAKGIKSTVTGFLN